MTKMKRRDFIVTGAAAGIAFPMIIKQNTVKPLVIASANGNRFENGGSAATLLASSINELLYPAPSARSVEFERKTVMQTFRIPLEVLEQQGMNTKHLTAIDLIFDQTPAGRVYLDDLQLTR